MFSGLVALIGALTGMFGGSIPKIFDLFQQKMTFAQEVKIRELEAKFRRDEHEMQLALAEKNISGKIEESTLEALKAEIQSNAAMTIEMMKSQAIPTGYVVIDAINAALRPFYFLGTILLFFLVVIQYMLSAPEAFAAQAATQFWIAVEGTVGFLSGYRSVVKSGK